MKEVSDTLMVSLLSCEGTFVYSAKLVWDGIWSRSLHGLGIGIERLWNTRCPIEYRLSTVRMCSTVAPFPDLAKISLAAQP